MNDVFVPYAGLLMIMVFVFKVAVGFLILSQGVHVYAGVVASVLLFLGWRYLLTNIVLGAVQASVALHRYDTSPRGADRSSLRFSDRSPPRMTRVIGLWV
jgi:uncharacterized BrkB/YihY/UPF0761 family membrane protein